ncbi:hypothetical protein [Lysinibacillus sphaericus]|uniref:hypothetical protein n=1 Tax=Lysinibacillus sphaericus TaxID=1421 RepID=UPI0012D2AFB9|nr:hypothetical protein [Lysinibacillus sphaericus]
MKHPLVLLEIKCPGHRVRFVVAIWCNQMLFQQANTLITSLHRTGYFIAYGDPSAKDFLTYFPYYICMNLVYNFVEC